MAIANNQYQKVVQFILFSLCLLLLYKLIEPMITILLSSVLLAYISFPLYGKIVKKLKNQMISIITSLIIVVILVAIPFLFLIFEITKEGYYFYDSISNEIPKGELFGYGCDSVDSTLCFIINQVEKINLEHFSSFDIAEKLEELQIFLGKFFFDLILNLPIIIAKIFITLIISYFIMRNWEKILRNILEVLPIKKNIKKRLILDFANITHTVIYAQLFIAFVQGSIAIVGFYIFGVPFPIILGVLLAFFALIPTIGTAFIWLPASLYLIFNGYFSSDYGVLFSGIGLFFYGMLIISTIDNILLAKIVNKKTNVNEVVIIVGVIGGVSMFGIMGLFIGPILLPLLLTYFKTFKEKFD